MKANRRRNPHCSPAAVSPESQAQAPLQFFDKAVSLHQAGKHNEAECIYRSILAADPNHAGALHLLGVLAQSNGEPQAAVELIGKAISLQADVASFHTNMGNALLSLSRLDEAVVHYRRALELKPELGSAHNNLGHALLCQGQRAEALAFCNRALEHMPDSPEALTNKANVLLELGNIDEAVALYRRALELKPGYLSAINNLGTAMLDLGRLDDAIEYFDSALIADPDCAESLLNKGVVQLLRGDFASGWPNYEGRLRMRRGRTRGRDFVQPQWRGEPLHGAKILLHTEQGLGDCIQFLRYVPQVIAAGGQVLLEIPGRIRRLAESIPGVSQIIVFGDRLPQFDWHCPLLSLPLAFETTLDTIPCRVPYLTVPEAEKGQAAAHSWPTSGLSVGLVWAGTPGHLRDWARSLDLLRLHPILDIEDVHFFSLQVGSASAQLSTVPNSITDLAPDPDNFADTAAKLQQLELIISVDTAVAHVAGALGKPVWLMLPYVPDWRWLLDREDSPWYPTMRLFRQPAPGDWDSVIESIRLSLLDLRQAQHQGSNLRPPQSETTSVAMHPVSTPAPSQCKICGAPSPLCGVIDFHKSCIEAQGKRLNLSGIPIYYRRCTTCRFVFTDCFDQWSEAAFAEKIYNQDYLLVDPDFVQLRPENNARLVAEAFAASRSEITILDYGGGSGRMAQLLREQGFSAATYDPFSTHRQPPEGHFDLITCFEVMEHTPQPIETMRSIDALLKPDGLLLFSTLLQPANFDAIGLNWWYASPRNGHLSLYSADALIRLFAPAGLRVASCNESLHLAYREVPKFAAHLRIGA